MEKANKKSPLSIILTVLICFGIFAGCSEGGGSTFATGKVAEKLELAVKYLTENKFEEAVLAYQEAIKIDKLAVKAYQGLGKVYALQGKFEDAQKIYQQGVESLKDKAQLQLRLSLAGMYIDKGDLKEAERLYKEIIAQNADCIEAYRGLALVYRQQGDLQQAKAVLEEATKVNSNSDRAYNALASYHIQNGEKDKAMELLVQSLSLNVNQTEAYSALKDLYSENWPELVQKAVGIQDQNVAAMIKFYALYESGKHQEALAFYEGLLKQSTNNHKARALAGIAALRAGDRQKAVELIQGMAPDQQNEWVMADIARYYLLAGDNQKAIKWAQKSFETSGQNMEAVKILYEIYSKDNSPLAKVYLAKLIMYNWLPLSVLKQELYAMSIELPFQLPDSSLEKTSGKDDREFESIQFKDNMTLYDFFGPYEYDKSKDATLSIFINPNFGDDAFKLKKITSVKFYIIQNKGENISVFVNNSEVLLAKYAGNNKYTATWPTKDKKAGYYTVGIEVHYEWEDVVFGEKISGYTDDDRIVTSIKLVD